MLAMEFDELTSNKMKQGEFTDGYRLSTLSFDTIKVQLQALGLVTTNREIPDEKKTETNRWRLTDKGRNRMYQILALKKTKFPKIEDCGT